MTVLGITGPTGAGKTTALRTLEAMGVRILDCDAVYHRLLETDLELRQALEDRFGPLFGPDGLDRKALGSRVWSDPEALADLNAITHRFIRRALEQELRAAEAAGLPGAAIDGVAIIEAGIGPLCHATVSVTAPAQIRAKRIMAREGIGEDYAMARIRAQKSDEWFIAHTDYHLVNDSTEEAFRQKAEALFRLLLKR
ncbi:MAG: dephospho-CoA kinase [Oscillospiraceae bacterium]|nr:dephospho-CoA kinase [Oscillospiraceae bacterium]